jgi:hypothetical protein
VVVQEENPYHYTGLHAFGFLRGAEASAEDVMAGLREMGAPPDGPVIWAGAFAGDYDGLVHARVEAGELGSLQELIAGEFRDRGFRGRWAIEARVAKKPSDDGAVALFVGVKRGTQEIIAISRLRVQPGALDDVMEALPSISTFRGASVVFGNADVLLQLGGAEFGEVAASVENEVQAVRGIASASTAFCDGRR